MLPCDVPTTTDPLHSVALKVAALQSSQGRLCCHAICQAQHIHCTVLLQASLRLIEFQMCISISMWYALSHGLLLHKTPLQCQQEK